MCYHFLFIHNEYYLLYFVHLIKNVMSTIIYQKYYNILDVVF